MNKRRGTDGQTDSQTPSIYSQILQRQWRSQNLKGGELGGQTLAGPRSEALRGWLGASPPRKTVNWKQRLEELV